jgi:hypothetical protein
MLSSVPSISTCILSKEGVINVLNSIPRQVGIELAAFAFLVGATLCFFGLKLVHGVRGKFYNKSKSRSFRATKRLALKDYLLLEMLQTRESSYCVTDPDVPDNPIVYSSDSFCRMTQYGHGTYLPPPIATRHSEAQRYTAQLSLSLSLSLYH